MVEYGNTITTFEYVYSQMLNTDLKLLQFTEAGAGHQDLYVFYRKPDFVRYLDESHEVISQLKADNQRLGTEIEALHRSTSWKVTGPLRMLSRAVKSR
jgi:hypothetical protein